MPEPVWPAPQWTCAAPGDLGLSEAALTTASAELARSSSNARALVVVRHGRIAWQRYFHGSGPQDRWHLFSITKSVTSALVGLALQNGAIQSIDQNVLEYFPEVALDAGSPLRLVTIRHLLSMTAGFLWPGGHHGLEPMAERLRRSPDWTRFILQLPVRREEIGRFHYCSAASHLLSALITRSTGQSACEYARNHLFDPLGICAVSAGSDWEADPQRLSIGGWGLHLTGSELARFGWLYLCRGRWGDRQVVPQAWVSASLTDQETNGYGYQWWLRSVAGQSVFAGLGYGGQYLFCLPDLDLEIVILSHGLRRWPDRWEWLQRLLPQFIL